MILRTDDHHIIDDQWFRDISKIALMRPDQVVVHIDCVNIAIRIRNNDKVTIFRCFSLIPALGFCEGPVDRGCSDTLILRKSFAKSPT